MVPKYPIAAKNAKALMSVGKMKKIEKRGVYKIIIIKTSPFTVRNQDNQLIIIDAETQVWVDVIYGGYNSGFKKAWKQEISALFNDSKIDYKGLIPEGYDIDHIFPRDKAKKYLYQWVRLFECPLGINRSYKNKICLDDGDERKEFDFTKNLLYVNQFLWNKWQMRPYM